MIKSPNYYSGLITILKNDSKSIKCKKGKACGDICIPKKYECKIEDLNNKSKDRSNKSKDKLDLSNKSVAQVSKKFNLPSAVAKGVIAGAATVGVPVASYAAFRANYQNNIKKSAQMAIEASKDIQVPDALYGGYEGKDKNVKADYITFVVGGFAGLKDGSSSEWVGKALMDENIDDGLFKNHHVVPITNEDFEVNKPIGNTNIHESTLDVLDTILVKSIKNGRNLTSVKLAKSAYAYNQKYPDKQINLIGQSGGTMVIHEAAQILDEMGIKNVKVVALAGPDFGLTNDLGNSITLLSDNDRFFGKARGIVRNKTKVDDVLFHSGYVVNRQARKTIDNFIRGESDYVAPSQLKPGETFDERDAVYIEKIKEFINNGGNIKLDSIFNFNYSTGINSVLKIDSKSIKCKKGKSCGDICIPKKYECKIEDLNNKSKDRSNKSKDKLDLSNKSVAQVSKKFNLPSAVAKGVIAGAATVGVPVASYAAFRANYQNNIKKSAQMAIEASKDIQVPDKIFGGYKDWPKDEEADYITFAVGGFAGLQGESSNILGQALAGGVEDGLFNNHHIVPITNEEFDLELRINPDAADNEKAEILKSIGHNMLGKLIKEGRNATSVKLAANAYAYNQKYPDKQINLIGTSAGGMVVHEAAQILDEMGIKNVKVVAMGSPYFGLTNDLGNSITLISDNDAFFKDKKYLIRNLTPVNDVAFHSGYAVNEQARKTIDNFIRGKPDYIEPSKLKEGEKYDERDLKFQRILEIEVRNLREKQAKERERQTKKDSYNFGVYLALRYDNNNKKLNCRPGVIAKGTEHLNLQRLPMEKKNEN